MAKYFLSDIDQLRAMIARIKEATYAKAEVEFTVKSKNKKGGRSQLNYVHVLFQIIAMNTGYTYDYCKYDYFKRSVNPDIFLYDRANPVTGEIKQELRSIESLNSFELTTAIDRLMNRNVTDHGFELPPPNNKRELERYEYLAQFYKFF